MKLGEQQREEAARYLMRNAELRRAVGAQEQDELVPQSLGMGEHNLNYSFAVPSSGRTFVLRMNIVTQPFHDDQVAYEYGALKSLAQSGCVPEAIYLDNSEHAPYQGALVISFCDGDMLNFDQLRPGDLQCAAQIMADVHAVPVASDCTVYRPKDPLKGLFEECVRRFGTYMSSGFEERHLTKWVESLIAAAEPVLDTACLPSDCTHIVNTETLPSHFLIPAASAAAAATAHGGIGGKSVAGANRAANAPKARGVWEDGKDGNAWDGGDANEGEDAGSAVEAGGADDPSSSSGRFCAHPGSFVDWERPIIGEVAQDVAFFVSPTTTFWDSEYLFPADAADAFVEDYWRAVDGRFERGNFDERFRAFRMMTALRSATWFCMHLPAYRQGTGHMTQKARRKFPIYLSDEFMTMLAHDCFGL